MTFDTFDVSEEDQKIIIYIEIPHRTIKKPEKFTFNTSDLISELQNRGLKVGECLKSNTLINYRENNRKGTWIFSKKALDKPAKDVIIKEEKEAKPKPTRKKRTSASTKKKVSTGE